MRGNSLVQFLGGRDVVTHCAYPTCDQMSHPYLN